MDAKLAAIMEKIKAEHPHRAESPVPEQIAEPLSAADLENVRELAKKLFNGDMQQAEAFYRRPAREALSDRPSMAQPPTTAAASKQISRMEKKKEARDFPTFIERSLPPGDRE